MLNLELTLGTTPVNIKTGEVVEKYYLKEMTAQVRDQYLDTVSDRVRVDTNGKVTGIKKFEGMQADLVSRCLFYGEGNSVDKLVPKAVIQQWPAGTMSALFKEAQNLNRINETDDADAASKKD